MKRSPRLLAGLAVVALAAGVVSGIAAVASTTPATAAGDASGFDAGMIISDDTFYNSAAMTPDSIQAFLNSQVVTCTGANGQPCLKDYRESVGGHAGDSYCNALAGSSNELASSIIYRVGQACGINPQVLVVMLQKEQGLVQAKSPTATAYKIAMGYGCPDTAACDTTYYGFSNQVWNAAHQFQRYAKTSSSWSYQPGRNNNIYYSPNAACGTKSVYIQNQATASLYLYTPYTPNAAALAAGYGNGDACSAYGNRNFYLYFTDWFGNPSNWFQSSSFEGGSTTGWDWSNGTTNRYAANDPGDAQSGNYFLAANTPELGRSVGQTVNRTTNVGEQATATVWLRSQTATPFTGTLALWGLGGTTELTQKDFTVGTTWTSFTLVLPVRNSAHSQIRLDIYMKSLGNSLWIDNTSLGFSAAPPAENQLRNASFEGSFANWVPGNGGFINQQIYNDPASAKDGNWFAVSNTATPNLSFSQTISSFGNPGNGYDLTLWLKSGASTPFTGTLALWGLGGSSNVVNTTSFTVGSSWTAVSVSLDPNSVIPSTLKAEIYMTTTGSNLWLDDASLSNNLLSSSSFEGSTSGWALSSSAMNLVDYATASTGIPSQSGGYFAATNATMAGTSLSQTATRTAQVGDDYTARVWVRAADATKPFNGRLALWALGGTTEATSVSFTATGTWTPVVVTLPIQQTGHTSFKFEIYEDSPGLTLFVDSARLY